MTTTYTFDQLKEDVRKEAEALRVHATAEELSKLDFKTFRPDQNTGCIYGQMCGGCRVERASDLIKMCCVSYIENHSYRPISGNFEWSNIYTTPDNVVESNTLRYLSAIEAYILLPEARNANLIAFLRGETDNLEL